MGGPGLAFTHWGMGGYQEPLSPYPYGTGIDLNSNAMPARAAFLAMRNSDGRKAYCAYCGSRATYMDGENCPRCGADRVEVK